MYGPPRPGAVLSRLGAAHRVQTMLLGSVVVEGRPFWRSSVLAGSCGARCRVSFARTIRAPALPSLRVRHDDVHSCPSNVSREVLRNHRHTIAPSILIAPEPGGLQRDVDRVITGRAQDDSPVRLDSAVFVADHERRAGRVETSTGIGDCAEHCDRHQTSIRRPQFFRRNRDAYDGRRRIRWRRRVDEDRQCGVDARRSRARRRQDVGQPITIQVRRAHRRSSKTARVERKRCLKTSVTIAEQYGDRVRAEHTCTGRDEDVRRTIAVDVRNGHCFPPRGRPCHN